MQQSCLRDEMLGIQISAEAFATEKSSSVGPMILSGGPHILLFEINNISRS